jgi:hypothetical protein
MKKSRAFASVAVAMFAVVSIAAQNAAPPRIPGIDTAGMDRSVRPQDDFFRFVNGVWVDKTPIPADRSSYGTFAELRDRAQEAVRGILEAAAVTPNAPGSIAQKVGGFYKSFVDDARVESLGIQPLAASSRRSSGSSAPASCRRRSLAPRRSVSRCRSRSRSVRIRADPISTPSSSRSRV